MVSFVVRRLVAGLGLVLAISFVTFALTRLLPGDPARTILGVTATAEQIAQKRAELGLDEPMLSSFWTWLTGVVTGDFGVSWYTPVAVMDTITTKLPITLSIALGATLVAAIVGIVLGLLAAARGGWIDKTVQLVGTLGSAIPNFVIAIGLILWLAIGLRMFPATGYVDSSVSFVGWITSITLPVIALAIGAIAAVALQVRSSARVVLAQPYIRTFRARGIGSTRLYLRHVLRNAVPPALTVLSLQFINLLSGAVIIEFLFSLPGIGALASVSATRQDVPTVLGLVVVTVVIIVIVNLLVDIAYMVLNPKVRI